MPPLTPVVKNLLIINVAVFAVLNLLPYLGIDTTAIANYLALYYPGSDKFHPVQLVTHFFMHGGLTHLFFNMFGLFMFGPLIERRYGPQRFLLLYLLAAAGAVLLHFGYTYYEFWRLDRLLEAFRNDPTLAHFEQFWKHTRPEGLKLDDGKTLIREIADLQNQLVLQTEDPAVTLRNTLGIMQEFVDYRANDGAIAMVGASGAIYGIVAAFAILYPDFPLMLIFLPVPIKARYFVPILLVVEIFLGVMQFSWDPIAHWAHLGGALLGGLLTYFWYRRDPPAGARRWN